MREEYKKKQARNLRRNMTEAEKRLWYYLRNREYFATKFRRQHPVGPYICDFASMEPPVVIEVDGGQHADRQQAYDIQRDSYLKAQGFTVLRFWNNDVLENTEGVLTAIMDNMHSPHPSRLRAIALRRATFSRKREKEKECV